MSLQSAKQAVLKHLFDAYEQNPSAIYDVTEVIRVEEQDPYEFGKYLVHRGWVKNHQYRATTFVCQISLDGINEIAPEYLEQKTETVISTSGTNGGPGSIMNILGY